MNTSIMYNSSNMIWYASGHVSLCIIKKIYFLIVILLGWFRCCYFDSKRIQLWLSKSNGLVVSSLPKSRLAAIANVKVFFFGSTSHTRQVTRIAEKQWCFLIAIKTQNHRTIRALNHFCSLIIYWDLKRVTFDATYL